MIAKQQHKSVGQKLWWLIQHRPSHLYRTARCWILFYRSRLMRHVSALPGIVLGENVRLQRNSSVMAEAPTASIEIGCHSIVYEDAKIEAYGDGHIIIGAGSIIGDTQIVCRYRVQIGARFLSSWNVFIQDFDPHPVNQQLRRQQVETILVNFRPRFTSNIPYQPGDLAWSFPGEEITIGDDVWIGAGCTILKGAKIGSGSIVATGAVVLRGSYPAGSLLAGNPAVVVKQISERKDDGLGGVSTMSSRG